MEGILGKLYRTNTNEATYDSISKWPKNQLDVHTTPLKRSSFKVRYRTSDEAQET
jgi:hypothetical protein